MLEDSPASPEYVTVPVRDLRCRSTLEGKTERKGIPRRIHEAQAQNHMPHQHFRSWTSWGIYRSMRSATRPYRCVSDPSERTRPAVRCRRQRADRSGMRPPELSCTPRISDADDDLAPHPRLTPVRLHVVRDCCRDTNAQDRWQRCARARSLGGKSDCGFILVRCRGREHAARIHSPASSPWHPASGASRAGTRAMHCSRKCSLAVADERDAAPPSPMRTCRRNAGLESAASWRGAPFVQTKHQ